MQGNDMNSMLALPKNRDFRPFIKTFHIFKQLMPNLFNMNNSEIPSIKRICVIFSIILFKASPENCRKIRLSSSKSSSVFRLPFVFDHILIPFPFGSII